MWLILDDCGTFAAFCVYFIVIFVYFGFMRVGIWEDMHEKPLKAFIHFAIFQYHCFLIFWSHFACMTTPGGFLKKEQEYLEFSKLQPSMQVLIKQVG
jgi:hypothetical protein